MSRAARFFEALKLVELDDEPSVPMPPVPATPPKVERPPPSPELDIDPDLGFPEGTALDSIYAGAGIPKSAFPIERLGKLLDGLSQLDPATKKTAVSAMDAADDSWTIDDAIVDARNKIAALDAHMAKLGELERGISAEVQRRIEASLSAKKSTAEQIDAQIADLEKQRDAAIAESATEVAKLRAQGTAAVDAADRERRRLAEAIKHYQGLSALFADAPHGAHQP